MKREKSTSISKDPDAIRKLESLRYVFRDSQSAIESGDQITYEWLEDSVIRKKASVEFGRNTTGKETATIKMIDPKTKKERSVYYTADKDEVTSLKRISEGKPLIIEATEEVSEGETME